MNKSYSLDKWLFTAQISSNLDNTQMRSSLICISCAGLCNEGHWLLTGCTWNDSLVGIFSIAKRLCGFHEELYASKSFYSQKRDIFTVKYDKIFAVNETILHIVKDSPSTGPRSFRRVECVRHFLLQPHT